MDPSAKGPYLGAHGLNNRYVAQKMPTPTLPCCTSVLEGEPGTEYRDDLRGSDGDYIGIVVGPTL